MKSLILLPLALAKPNPDTVITEEVHVDDVVHEVPHHNLNVNWQQWQNQFQNTGAWNRPWPAGTTWTQRPIMNNPNMEFPKFTEFREKLTPIVRPYVQKMQTVVHENPQMFDMNNPMFWMLMSGNGLGDNNMLMYMMMSDPNFMNDPNNPMASLLFAKALSDDEESDDDDSDSTTDNMLLMSMLTGNPMMAGNNMLPLLLMTQDSDNSMTTEDLITLMMFSGGQMGNNQMLPWMLMTQDSDSDDDTKMEDLLMMMMFSGQNGQMGMGNDMISMLMMSDILKKDESDD